MVLDKKLILVGYSGHSYVLIDSALENGYNFLGYTENKIQSKNPYNLTYLGHELNENFNYWNLSDYFVIGIGDNHIREKIFFYLKNKNKKIVSIIDKSSSISKSCTVGSGTYINKNVIVNAFSSVGNNSILNSGCIIEHDCTLGNSVHVGPGAVVTGNVKIGDRTFIGANSVIKPGVNIGKDVIIGAGAVVLKDINFGEKIVGNPGKNIL